MKKTRVFLLTLCVLLVCQTAYGQTIQRRFDFDSNLTLGAPVTSVIDSPDPSCAHQGANGTASGSPSSQTLAGFPSANGINPAGATFGTVSATDATSAGAGGNSSTSNGYFVIGGGSDPPIPTCDSDTERRREVRLEFPAILGSTLPSGADVLVIFRAIGIGLNGNVGIDAADEIRVSVSLNGGMTFAEQIRFNGGGDTGFSYSPVSNFAGTFGAPLEESAPPNNRLILTIPAANITAASSIVLRFDIRVDRGDELIALDDIIVATTSPTASTATVSGSVTTANKRSIFGARVEAVDATTGEVFYTRTTPNGTFAFRDLQVGNFYIFSVSDKRYRFVNNPQSFQLVGTREDLLFVAQ